MRLIAALFALLIATTSATGETRADYVRRHWHPSLSVSHLMPLAWYQAYAFGIPVCFATGVMIESGIMLRRELTTAEAWTMFGNCILPVLGGIIVKDFFDRHPEFNIPGETKRLDLGIGSQR